MPKTFYLLHGSDELRIEEEVRKFTAQMGDGPEADMNTTYFDGETASAAEILNAVTSFPFLADKRLVIVRGLLAWITRKGAGDTGKDAVQRLSEALPALPDWARLVFVERASLSDKHPILKLAQQHENGYAKAFDVPKDTTGWIIQRARETYEAEIEPRAAQALAQVTGDDLRRADNEIIKLVAYVAGERAINEDDVAALTPYVPEVKVFDMVDRMAEGRADEALKLLHQLLEQDPRDEGFGLYGMIVRQFRLLLIAKEHLTLKGGRAGLAEALGTRSNFVADKAARQSRLFTIEQLEEIYHVLHDYDLKVKTGRMSPQLALDLIITGVAR